MFTTSFINTLNNFQSVKEKLINFISFNISLALKLSNKHK